MHGIKTFFWQKWIAFRRRYATFDATRLPPRAHWTYVFPETITDFGAFLAQAGDLVNEKEGFFGVQIEDGSRRRVRLEWPFDLGWPRGKGRVGLVFSCDRNNADPAEAYFANEADLSHPAARAPRPLTNDEHLRASAEIAGMVGEARRRGLSPRMWSVPFTVAVPLNGAIPHRTATNDGNVTWFPSRFVPGRDNNRRLSPLLIKGAAASEHLAKESAGAMADVVRGLAAINTVAGAFELVGPPWVDGERSPPAAFDPQHVISESLLMPPGAHSPQPSEMNNRFVELFCETWTCFQANDAREALVPALGAFIAGREVLPSNPTLGAVAFLAALGSLAHDLVERCPASNQCSTCGTSISHYRVGDAAAICEMVCSTLGLRNSAATEVTKVLKAAYSQQRSAFVHQAVFRHNEQTGGSISRMAFPGAENEQLLEHNEVLHSVERITRAMLVALTVGPERRDSALTQRGIELDRLRARIPAMHGVRMTPYLGVRLGL